ncbi:transporter [Acinetobacter johnsonii]|uniref:transporter n=1 Tax=Acinetobacter TaxID=469 RepID=UPI00132827DD|nr:MULTISPECIES: transporter [Acinetobacter]MWC18545.1 transporter [Acinetobacter johnsonii]NAR64584.1 transporter [Acinetobacter haemolyticus]
MNVKNGLLLGSICSVISVTSHAFDMLPADFTWMGDGTTVGLAYFAFQDAKNLKVDGVGEIPDSKAQIDAAILRAVRWKEIAGYKTVMQTFLTSGYIDTAKVAGIDQPKNSGIGDLNFGFTIYPMASNEPTGTTLTLSGYLTAPTGNYDVGKVNIGSGTWVLTPQIGLIQGLGNGFLIDAAYDVGFYKTKDHNGFEVKTDASSQAQAYLRYQPSVQSNYAVGISKKFGGKQYLNDQYTGMKNDVTQLRLTTTHAFQNGIITTGMLARDVQVEGGFKNDISVLFRVGKAF